MFPVDQVKVLPFGARRGSYNMALDSRLLELCERDSDCGFLRLYTWRPPALSLGFFEPDDAVDREKAARSGIDVVRRPTGGRVVLHKGDLTYSVVVPRGAAAAAAIYARISECIATGLRSLGADVQIARGAAARSAGPARPCFLSASRHEIVHHGRKVVGSAQRAGRNALLQHGSIALDRGCLEVVDYINCPEDGKEILRRDMLAATACVNEILESPADSLAVAAALLKAFEEGLACRLARVSQDTLDDVDAGGRAGLTP